MIGLVVRRLAIGVLLVLVVSFLVFVLIDLAPGDAASRLAGDDPTPERIDEIRTSLGLDDPLPTRYARWLGDAVTGDLGTSLATDEDVTGLIGKRLPITASLVIVALLAALVISLVLGIVASLRPDGVLDRVITAVAAVATATPPFWIGLLLVVNFSLTRAWFPSIGYEPLQDGFGPWIRHLVLPATALALFPAAEFTMQLRTALTEVMRQPHIVAATARGLRRHRVILRHGLKNAAAPLVTVFGLRLAALLGGAVTIETVFALPGLGTLAVNSALSRDVPVLLGLVTFAATITILLNLIVDLSYGWFNPKVRR